MSTLRPLLTAMALTLGLCAPAFAKVNCSDVKNKNQDECVRAKANTNNRDMDDVNCSKANDSDVRQACRKAKY